MHDLSWTVSTTTGREGSRRLHWNSPPTLHQQCAMKIQQSGRSASTSEACPSFIHQLWPFYPYVLSLKCPCPPAAPLAACTSQTFKFFFSSRGEGRLTSSTTPGLQSDFPRPRIKQPLVNGTVFSWRNKNCWFTPPVLLWKLTLHTKRLFSPGFAL